MLIEAATSPAAVKPYWGKKRLAPWSWKQLYPSDNNARMFCKKPSAGSVGGVKDDGGEAKQTLLALTRVWLVCIFFLRCFQGQPGVMGVEGQPGLAGYTVSCHYWFLCMKEVRTCKNKWCVHTVTRKQTLAREVSDLHLLQRLVSRCLLIKLEPPLQIMTPRVTIECGRLWNEFVWLSCWQTVHTDRRNHPSLIFSSPSVRLGSVCLCDLALTYQLTARETRCGCAGSVWSDDDKRGALSPHGGGGNKTAALKPAAVRTTSSLHQLLRLYPSF